MKINEYIKLLAEIDYISFLLAFFTLIAAIVAGKNLLEKFCDIVGIELKYIKEKKEIKECQTTVKKELQDIVERQDRFEKEHRENMEKREEFNKEVLDSMNSLKYDFKILSDTIDRREAEKRFKKLRFDILNMADRLCRAESVTAEMLAQVMDECSEYEQLSKEYKFKNNRVNISIGVIQKKYEEFLLAGKIISGE